jgi:hypothetical protein
MKVKSLQIELLMFKTYATIEYFNICINLLQLIPKGPKVLFSKNAPNLPFLAQEAQMKFFSLLSLSIIGSCTRLLGEHVQKVLQHLTPQIVRL